VVRESRTRLEALPEPSLEGVRAAARPVIAASADAGARIEALKAYLTANVYRHPRVMRVVAGAEQIVRDLFARYLADPAQLPGPWHQAACAGATQCAQAAVVADFVAGMTDRYAIAEHRRLFDATPDLR
jgi:dGTPase